MALDCWLQIVDQDYSISDKYVGGSMAIAKALGVAAVKALVCVSGIIIAGRILLRPVFRRINQLDNDEMFAATTLLVVLGSSVLTQIAGLSQALGAFLAGLLMAETEYALQVCLLVLSRITLAC